MLALVQAWVLATAYALDGRLHGIDFVNVCLLVLCLVLALSASLRVQHAGVWLAWILGIAAFVLRWVG